MLAGHYWWIPWFVVPRGKPEALACCSLISWSNSWRPCLNWTGSAEPKGWRRQNFELFLALLAQVMDDEWWWYTTPIIQETYSYNCLHNLSKQIIKRHDMGDNKFADLRLSSNVRKELSGLLIQLLCCSLPKSFRRRQLSRRTPAVV